MESVMNTMLMRKRVMKMVPLITMMIWGSMYVASRVVLQSMPALLLLFLRFSISGALLLGIACGLLMVPMKGFLLSVFGLCVLFAGIGYVSGRASGAILTDQAIGLAGSLLCILGICLQIA